MATRTGTAIAARFQKILDWARLTDRDVQAFDRHRQSITRALQAGVRLNQVHRIGSFERGTAVRGSSDADLLAVTERKEVTWGDSVKTSDTVLATFRQTLSATFQRTEIGRDQQAVVIDFGDGEHPVDVVPAFYAGQDGYQNHPVFWIPDGTRGWMKTSPSSHNRYLRDADQQARGHLRAIAMMFRFWRTTRSTPVPISGFHVELMLASRQLSLGVRTYSGKFRDLLVELSNRECAALNDPVQISGRIAACGTEAKRAQSARTVADAAYHADQAVKAEAVEDLQEAWKQWNVVFNNQFPRDGA